MITKLPIGNVYEYETTTHQHIFAQVGQGGDCGIFCPTDSNLDLSKGPDFRIIIAEQDIKRNWVSKGVFELAPTLEGFGNYSRTEIGSDVKYKVSLGNLSEREVIDNEEFKKLEPLAIWETQHIVQRTEDG